MIECRVWFNWWFRLTDLSADSGTSWWIATFTNDWGYRKRATGRSALAAVFNALRTPTGE